MRQLRVTEPWADLAYGSDKEKLQDLMIRIQMLEARVRELEAQTTTLSRDEVSEGVPVGV